MLQTLRGLLAIELTSQASRDLIPPKSPNRVQSQQRNHLSDRTKLPMSPADIAGLRADS